jgi:hypothetical protein
MDQRRDDLLDWYLAHLRKNALSRQKFQDLTPMALVDSDKEMLKQLVEQSAVERVSEPHRIPQTIDDNYWMIQLAITITVTGLLLIAALSAK